MRWSNSKPRSCQTCITLRKLSIYNNFHALRGGDAATTALPAGRLLCDPRHTAIGPAAQKKVPRRSVAETPESGDSYKSGMKRNPGSIPRVPWGGLGWR